MTSAMERIAAARKAAQENDRKNTDARPNTIQSKPGQVVPLPVVQKPAFVPLPTPTGTSEADELRAETRQRNQLASGQSASQVAQRAKTRNEQAERIYQSARAAERNTANREKLESQSKREAAVQMGGETAAARALTAQADALKQSAAERTARQEKADAARKESQTAAALQGYRGGTAQEAQKGLNAKIEGFVEFDPDRRRAKQALSAIQSGEYGLQPGLSKLTDEEKNIFLSAVGRGDWSSAGKYLSLLERDLNRRDQEAQSAESEQYAYEHPVAGTVSRLGAGLFRGLGYAANAGQAVKNAVTGDYEPTDPNSKWFRAAHGARDLQSGLEQRAEDAGGPVARQAASLGLSAGDMVMQMGVGGLAGPSASLGLMGASVAGDTTLDSLERGGTPGQALANATVAGAAEILTEKLPVDQLFSLAKGSGKTGVREVVRGLLGTMGSEGAQEAVTEIADNLADQAIMGDKSQYENYVRSLMEGGMDEAGARSAATKQFYLSNVGQAAAGGALLGGVMGAGAQALGYANGFQSRREGRAVDSAYQAMRDNGLFSDQAAQARQQANRVLGLPVYRPSAVMMPVFDEGGKQVNAEPATQQAQKNASTGEAGKVNPGARASIRETAGNMPSTDYQVPRISMPTDALVGADGVQVAESKIPAAIRKYMGKLFKGKVLKIGSDHKVYIDKGGIEEFAFPAKRIDGDVKSAKMTAGANLDTTLDPAVFLMNTVDDGHHAEAVGGWDNFYVMFQTDTGTYSGIVKTKVTDRGRVFHDITEIQKEESPSARGDNRETPPPAWRSASSSDTMIPQAGEGVKGESAPKIDGVSPEDSTAPRKIGRQVDISERTWEDASDRRVNAFQYDRPELRPYYQRAARELLEELGQTIRGERAPILDADGYVTGYSGTKRAAAAPVEQARDNAKLTYAQISKAAEDLIADHGQENYAAAKKVEMILDDMLSEGYENSAGAFVEPDTAYTAARDAASAAQAQDDTRYRMSEDEWRSLMGQEPGGVSPEDSTGAAPLGFDPYSHLQNQTDSFHPDGETPARQVDVPTQDYGGRNIPKSAATVMEAQATPDSAVGVIQDAIAKGEFSFDTITDRAAQARAREIVTKNGFDGAKVLFHQAAAKGRAGKYDVALGQVLLNNAMNAGDSNAVIDILADYSAMSTTAAQAMQAQRMLKKLSPEGQLYAVQRSVESYQEEIQKRLGDKAPEITVDKGLYQEFLDASDQTGRDAAMEKILQNVADQVQPTWTDKWNAWRYLSMLGNPRTHVRNIAGNAGFVPVRMVKDAIATVLESGVDVLTPGGIRKTKAALNPLSEGDRALVTAAFRDIPNVEEQLLGSGKYSDSTAGQIRDRQTVFKTKPLEALRKFSSTAMDVEDTWFSKPAYAGALAGYLKANGISAQSLSDGSADVKLLDDARAYAVREAQRATYRDANALSDTVAGLRFRNTQTESGKTNYVKAGINALAEGVLPFRRTPANILARGLEYSPAGLVKGLTADLVKVHSGEITAAEAIDNISAGLTGTGLLALGAFLAAQGLVSGGGGDDQEQDAQDDLTGGQSYALSIGGNNYTLDWLAPEALPFFTGVELYNAISDQSEGGVSWKSIEKALYRVTDPMLEMSMLQGLQDAIESVKYNDAGQLPRLISNAAISYLSQGLPTLLGQAERTGESDRETTFVDRNSGAPNDRQYLLGKTLNKIPGVEFQQMPYIDAWGRTESNGTLPERAFNNFLNPSYVSAERETAADRELQRLKDAGHDGVFPQRVSQSEKPGGEYLTQDQYETYAKTVGTTSYDMVSDLISTPEYKAMSDEEKADAVELAYRYAKAVGKEAVSDYEPDAWISLARAAKKELGLSEAEYLMLYQEYGGAANEDGIREAYQAGIEPEEYLGYRQSTEGLKADKDASGKSVSGSKKEKIIQAIQGTGLSAAEKDWLYRSAGYAESGLSGTPWHRGK